MNKYTAYRTEELKKMYRRIKHTINDNRRKIRRLIREIEELTMALEKNNKDKKILKRELKGRKNNE